MVSKAFDYAQLNGSATRAKEIAGAIRGLSKTCSEAAYTMVQSAKAIGNLLIEAKQKVGHGNWKSWVSAEFGWTERTARNYMAIAEKFSAENVSDLPLSVLYVLAGDDVPKAAVDEVRAIANSGDKVTPSVARSVVKKHTEREPKKPNRIADAIEKTYPSTPKSIAVEPVKQAPSDVAAAEVRVEPIVVEPVPVVGQWKPVKKMVLSIGPEKMAQVRSLLLAARELGEEDFESLVSSIDFDLDVLAKRQPVETAVAPNTDSLIEFDPLDLKSPDKFDGKRFRDAWSRWVQFNIESKQPLTKVVAESQMKMLSDRSLDAAIAAIDTAIANRSLSIPKAKDARPKFTPPTIEEVKEHLKSIKAEGKVDPERFIAYYEVRKWRTNSGVPVSNWKAAVTTWLKGNEPNAGARKSSEEIDGAYREFKPDRTRQRSS
ncbi:MAG: DUF3102 domain-containing protein [Pirellulales bacterium]